MSTFVQYNNGGNANNCTQTFSSKDSSQFKQYGGGVQVIDGVRTYTQTVNDNEMAFQTPQHGEGKAHYVQNVRGNNAIAFQAHNMTTTFHK